MITRQWIEDHLVQAHMDLAEDPTVVQAVKMLEQVAPGMSATFEQTLIVAYFHGYARSNEEYQAEEVKVQ